MTDISRSSNLALVLSGGGARASYQVGVLAAIAERWPDLQVPVLTGVSAGAINAISLAAHRGSFREGVESLRAAWLRITPEHVYRVKTRAVAGRAARLALDFVLGKATDAGTLPGLMDMGPLRNLLGGMIDFTGIDANIDAGRLRAVALTATSYATGQTVTFIHGEPHVTLWERTQRTAAHARLALAHVMASSAIPLIFPAVEIEGRFYGDGSVRQTTPLSPAIHLGADRLLVIGMRPGWARNAPVIQSGYPTTAQIMALLFDSVFLDALDADAERLGLVNRLLAAAPAPKATAPLKQVKLLMLRPSRGLGDLAAGLTPRLPRPLNQIVKSIGGSGQASRDFLSYLLFDPAYTSLAMELGHDDTRADVERIERFLEAGPP